MPTPPLPGGPTPAYNNVPINTTFYLPSRFVISSVSLGTTTTITTSTTHNFVVGQEVRLIIPPSFGCRQLNEQSGFVISLPSPTQVQVNINSLGSDAYVASSATTVAQILAIGDTNSGNTNSSGRINLNINIPGSFQNISP